MTLEEIQELLNTNQIDLRKLDGERLSILDGLQKKGELQTRPIKDILGDQTRVANELAQQKTAEYDPIRAKTGDILNRDTVQAVFDIGAFGAQLLMDRTRLAKIVANPTKYASLISKLKPEAFTKTSNNQFSNALMNIDRIGGLDPSKPIGAILRPVVAGTLGYTAGGQAYDIADEIIRAKEGIETTGYKGKDTSANPFLQAADDLATGLAWSAGAELLAPIAFGAGKLTRQFLGLEGDYAKKIKQLAETNGLEASAFEAADPNTIGGRILTGFNKVFGQIPFVGLAVEQAKQKRVAAFAQKFEDIFNFQPNMHLAQLASVSDNVAGQMQKNYQNFRNMADVRYTLFRQMSNQFGDPMIIPMNHQRQFYNYIKASDNSPVEFKLTMDNELLQTPIGRFMNSYENLLKANRLISPNEYLDMRRLLNNAVARSPNNLELINVYRELTTRMEKDFASINLDPTSEIFLKYTPPNKAIADQVIDATQPVKTTLGAISGAGGQKLNQEAVLRLKSQLDEANKFYSENIISFESPLADKIRTNFGKNLFTDKQIAGFFESGNKNADQLAKTVADNIFMSSANKQSFDAVTDLQKLVQADVYKINPKTGDYTFVAKGTPDGNATLKRLHAAYLSDAYQKSFVKASSEENFIQDLIGRERTYQEARLPAQMISDMKLPKGESISQYIRGNVQFDPDTFRKLVLPSGEYAKKFEMILGPEQGKKMVKEVEDLIGYISALNKIEVPSSSTFLARRLILTGGSVGLLGGMYGMDALGVIPLLALGFYTNKFFVSPERLKAINSSFKTYLEAAETGDKTLGEAAMRRSIVKILNVLSNDYPNDPRKFGSKNISTKELLEKLTNDRYIPDDLKGLHIDPKQKERLFASVPDNMLGKVLPPPEIDDLFRPIGGAPRNDQEEQMMREATRQAPPGPLQTALPRLPGIVPLTQTQPVNSQRFAAAFPTDTLGILAAQGRENV